MSNVHVITRNELDAIRGKLVPPPVDTLLETRRTLKAKSDERASKWPNTLQATRERKERTRQERMAVEEAERVEVDRREAAMREECRREQIERANRILFDDTDRVKGFHSTLMMSDVLKERESQIEYKRQVGALKKAQERGFHEEQILALEAAEAAELRKLEDQRDRALKQRDQQLAQLEELKKKLLAERKDNRREGELLRQKACEEAEELRVKENFARDRAKQAHRETMEANKALQAFKLKELERERETEKAIEEYSKRKERMMMEREKREAEKVAKKEADKKRMMDHMEQNYLEEQAKAEERLARSLRAWEEQQQKQEDDKKTQLKQELESIHRSRQQQLRLKADAKHRQVQEEKDMVAAWKRRTHEIQEEERCEIEEKRARDLQIQAMLKHQIDRKAQRKAKQKQDEDEVGWMLQSSLQEEEERFQKYAGECIGEWEASGKNVKPITLYMTKKPPLESS